MASKEVNESVEDTLIRLGLEAYIENFIVHEIDEETFVDLTKEEIQKIIPNVKFGPLKKLLSEIERRKTQNLNPASRAQITSPTSGIKERILKEPTQPQSKTINTDGTDRNSSKKLVQDTKNDVIASNVKQTTNSPEQSQNSSKTDARNNAPSTSSNPVVRRRVATPTTSSPNEAKSGEKAENRKSGVVELKGGGGEGSGVSGASMAGAAAPMVLAMLGGMARRRIITGVTCPMLSSLLDTKTPETSLQTTTSSELASANMPELRDPTPTPSSTEPVLQSPQTPVQHRDPNPDLPAQTPEIPAGSSNTGSEEVNQPDVEPMSNDVEDVDQIDGFEEPVDEFEPFEESELVDEESASKILDSVVTNVFNSLTSISEWF